MKQTCTYCLTTRPKDKLWEEQPGSWYCRAWSECRAFYAKLPAWIRGVAA